jgi:peptidoglycan L-alanyl-D-glutamate endopeptidase CwlK
VPTLTSTEKRIAFFYNFSKLVIQAKIQDIDLIITGVFRTPEQQHAVYLAGKSQCDGYVKRSKHQDWLAVDAYVVKDGAIVWGDCPEYQTIGQLWKDLGMIWGGDFKGIVAGDLGHFEWKDSDNA